MDERHRTARPSGPLANARGDTGDALLSVRHLSKRFGGLLALASIDFDVAEGDVFGIIGPNGAGKTTLFSCLVGALPPTSGEIRFRGERIDRLSNPAVVRPRHSTSNASSVFQPASTRYGPLSVSKAYTST